MLMNQFKQKASALASRPTSFIKTQARNFQLHGSKVYYSGFEKTLLEKLMIFKAVSKISIFTYLALANGFAYGLSYFMTPQDYVYYFGYRGSGKMSEIWRSQIGSNVLGNAAWTVPSLLLFGQYMQGKIGQLKMLKFFALATTGILSFKMAFNPNPYSNGPSNFSLLKGYFPKYEFDADGVCPKYGKYFMGSDQYCQSIIYFTLLYHRMWAVSFAFMAFDFAYYGPMTLGGPLSAVIGALTLL